MAGLGWFLTWRKVIDQHFLGVLNTLIFKVFLPMMLFNNIYRIDFSARFDLPLVLFAGGMVVFVFVALSVILPFIIKDKGMLASSINAIFRSNYIIYAVPIISNMFGPEGTLVASMLSPVAVGLYNFFGVIVMCSYSGKQESSLGRSILNTIKDIVRHPLIIASVSGTLVALSGIQFPSFIHNTVATMGSLGSPLGLLLMGAQLDWNALRGDISLLLKMCGLRLVIIPVACMIPAVLLGFRGASLGTLFMLFGTPCPVTSAVMARNYNMAPRYTAQLVVMSTVLSTGTIFCGISIMRGLGLI